MDLHEFNERCLNAMHIVDASGEGHLSRKVNGDLVPFTVNKKRVILPTKDNLRNPPEGTVIYHPLSENITRGESDMIKGLRDHLMFNLTVTAITLLTQMATVAATPSEHKRLGPQAGKFLKDLPDMDKKTAEFLINKVLTRIGTEPERRLIHISLRKGGAATRDGVLRSAIFKFPVLEEMVTNDKEILGVKYPSKKVYRTLVTLMEMVLGDKDTRDSFNYGSKNQTAPYFHALMMAFYNITTHLNKLIKDHRKLLGEELADELMYDHSWVEAMDDLAKLRKVVPPQVGNEGAIIVSEKKKAEPEEPVTKNLAKRLLPADRDEDRTEEKIRREDLPFDPDEDDEPVRQRPASRQPARKEGVSLDELLDRKRGGGRDRYDDRYDDRRSRFGRDERPARGRFDDRYEDRRDRLDFGQGRRSESRGGWGGGRDRGFNLGLDDRRGRDRRGRDDGSRSFGQGHRPQRSNWY